MGVTSWAVPVGVLAAIVIVAFVFVWWWFPRAWNKGNKKDADVIHELSTPEREEQRRKNKEIIERFTRARAVERGEIVEPPAYAETDDGKFGAGAGVGFREGEVVR